MEALVFWQYPQVHSYAAFWPQAKWPVSGLNRKIAFGLNNHQSNQEVHVG
jgi:hypothetical protein